MTEAKKVFVVSNKKDNLNGVITNIDENNVAINWENDTIQEMTNEALDTLLTDEETFEVSEVELEEEAGQTPAQASIATHKSADASNGDADGNPKTRFDWIRAIVGNLADADTKTLTAIYDQQQSMIGGEAERAGVADNAGKNQASIAMKPSAAHESVEIKLQKEAMDTLFGETELTEEFKTKVATLFESAVSLRLTEEIVKIQESYDAKLQEGIDTLTGELTEGINDFITHVAEEWVEENRVAIESTLRTELTQEFIGALKETFLDHYIDLPEEQVSVVEALTTDLESAKAALNEETLKLIEKNKEIQALTKAKVVSEMSLGLTLPQRQKLDTLIEGVDFEDIEAFKKKVTTIKEGFVVTSKDTTILTENVVAEEDKPEDTSMDHLAASVARHIAKTNQR